MIILYYICIRWLHEETYAGENQSSLEEPYSLQDPIKSPSLMGVGTFDISFYNCNDRKLKAP